jgi:DNA topoisomerase-6 subunit B
MNVVWIDDAVAFEKGRHKVKVQIYNYTPKQQRFKLHTVLPTGCLDINSCNIKPVEVKEDEKVTWELPKIASTAVCEVCFELTGLDQDMFSETELYVSGINPVDVMGADPLPGDWDLQGVNFTETEAVVPEKARRLLTRFDARAAHYDTLLSPF